MRRSAWHTRTLRCGIYPASSARLSREDILGASMVKMLPSMVRELAGVSSGLDAHGPSWARGAVACYVPGPRGPIVEPAEGNTGAPAR